jgi:hypothetical protein
VYYSYVPTVSFRRATAQSCFVGHAPQLAVHHGAFPINHDTIVCAIHLRRISRVWQSLYIHARRIDDGIRSLSVEIVGAAAPAATVTVGFGVGATTGGASEAIAAY